MERMTVLAGLRAVDWVVPFSEDTPARLIGRILPDILVKGGDYHPEQIAGADAGDCARRRSENFRFSPGMFNTGLINKIKEAIV